MSRRTDLAVAMVGIDKSFPGVVANIGVDFSACWGEVHALLGENGAGKTTLMSILAGLYRPDAGQIRIDGEPVTFSAPRDAIRHGVGMVYQHYRLVASQTVAENLLLGLPGVPFRLDTTRFVGQARELGRRYHMQIDPSRAVWQLSVGEQQRVEILKTLQRGAQVLILDEPTAVLTPQESEELMRTLRQIAAEGRTVILISHKLEEIRSVADRVSVLRSGSLVAGGLPIGAMSARDLARLMVGESAAATLTRLESARSARALATESGADSDSGGVGSSGPGVDSDSDATASPVSDVAAGSGSDSVFGSAASRGHTAAGGNGAGVRPGSDSVVGSAATSDAAAAAGQGSGVGSASVASVEAKGSAAGNSSGAPAGSDTVLASVAAGDASLVVGGDGSAAGSDSGAVVGKGSAAAPGAAARSGTRDAAGGLVLERVSALDTRGLPALRQIDMHVATGEILGIAGVAGNGQRELAQIVAGLRRPTHGRVVLNGIDVTGRGARAMIRAGVAHVPEDRLGEGLVGNLPLSDNAVLKAYDRPPLALGPLLQLERVIRFTQSLLDRFSIRGARPQSATRLLSGGQLQRLLLAREMALDPRVIVAVHPTRGLDVAATQQVHEWLIAARNAGTSVLLISEDLDEVLQLSDRVSVLYEGRVMGTTSAAGVDREQIGLLMAGASAEAAGVA